MNSFHSYFLYLLMFSKNVSDFLEIKLFNESQEYVLADQFGFIAINQCKNL